jgi:L-alanine-DL-glutamate epimerase-like enolase superfamily enzyme
MSRNSNYYEVALVGPNCPNAVAPVYLCDYSDQLNCVDENGMVKVPDRLGLGVSYDWDFIKTNRNTHLVFD